MAVLGAGSWGTALAHHLRSAGHRTTLWGRDPAVLGAITTKGINPRYFPGQVLAAGIATTTDLEACLVEARAVVVSLPSQTVRRVASLASPHLADEAVVVSTTKGLEAGTHRTMSEVLAEERGSSRRIAVLSGPSFAQEVVRGLPTAVTMAASERAVAEEAAGWFHHGAFRVYTSTDRIGVEMGGVLKNVVALAAGMVDGFGMGHNARAALLTRGLAEMERLVVALGGKAETVSGLSGLGDLLLTATGDLSRNRRVGVRLGQGGNLPDILEELGQTAEGVSTALLALELARELHVEAPIIQEVNRVVAGESTVEQSVRALLARAPREERV